MADTQTDKIQKSLATSIKKIHSWMESSSIAEPRKLAAFVNDTVSPEAITSMHNLTTMVNEERLKRENEKRELEQSFDADTAAILEQIKDMEGFSKLGKGLSPQDYLLMMAEKMASKKGQRKKQNKPAAQQTTKTSNDAETASTPLNNGNGGQATTENTHGESTPPHTGEYTNSFNR